MLDILRIAAYCSIILDFPWSRTFMPSRSHPSLGSNHLSLSQPREPVSLFDFGAHAGTAVLANVEQGHEDARARLEVSSVVFLRRKMGTVISGMERRRR